MPEFALDAWTQHVRLHVGMADHGPLPRCAEHKIDRSPRDVCTRHATQFKKLLFAFERFGLLEEAAIRQALDRLATVMSYVTIAAYAAAESESRREHLAVKPRGGPPRGWSLGRELLRRWKLPAEYLPSRRDVWASGAWKKETRREISHRETQSAWRESNLASNRYHRALLPYQGKYAAALLTASDAERGADGRWTYDERTVHGKALARAKAALGKAKERFAPLAAAALRARAGYKGLVAPGRTADADSASLKVVLGSLPTAALSPFWTAATRELTALYEPYVAKHRQTVRRSRPPGADYEPHNQGYTSLTVARLTLAVLTPLHHLETSFGQLRDRVRPPPAKV